MSDDRIERLARAYREAHDGRSDRAEASRVAILAVHRDRRRRERGWWLVAAGLVLSLLSLPTAWALYTGLLSTPAADGARVTPPSTSALRAGRTTEATPIAPDEPPPLAAEPPSPPPPSLPPPERAAAPATRERPAVAAVPAETEAEAPAIDPAERLAYEEAHHLHFEAHDAAGAVVAWERYLSAYPGGRFAPEARYNRALSLIRLGRRAEAVEALRPFADGAHGSYRRREASELLGALETP